MLTVKNLERKAIERRMDLLRMIYKSGSGHIGGSLSSVEILVVLYYAIMHIDPINPYWEDRDRFVLSKGHSVEAYYSILANLGLFSSDELTTFSRFGSRLTGHPTVDLPGVEMNTGSLGHGLSAAVGMALAGKMDNRDYRVFALLGDGELNEGSVWEAALAGAHYRLDNLVAIVDRNGLQISGNTEEIMGLGNLSEKWAAFGWNVHQTDGHQIEQLLATFQALPYTKGKPQVVIAHTIKGKGISLAENNFRWHHYVPDSEEFMLAMRELELKLKEISIDD